MNSGLIDPALTLVARARELEAARNTVLAAGGDDSDAADGAIYDALDVVPTTLNGVRAKIAMGLEIEAVNWPSDAVALFRSILASPAV